MTKILIVEDEPIVAEAVASARVELLRRLVHDIEALASTLHDQDRRPINNGEDVLSHLATGGGPLPHDLPELHSLLYRGRVVIVPVQDERRSLLSGQDICGGQQRIRPIVVRIDSLGAELADGPPGLLVLRKVAPTPPGFPRRPGVAKKRPLA